jgi:hypothetical protein
MNFTVKAGLVLGIAAEIWIFLLGIMGWYKDPVLMNLFWVVILIHIGVLIWGLRSTRETKTYGQQVGAGTLISLYGAVIIFFGSILFTAVVFPNYFADVRAAGEETMRSQGMVEADITAQLDAMAPMQTTFMNAISGFIGTVLTGILVSLVIAIFFKKKSEAQPAA